jgi:DNA-binding Lrp family transcriptional regulator
MDETDLILSLHLLRDSRTSYRELADKLSLSVPSVHKRIQAMRAAGIIRAFTARVSLYAQNALHVLIFGRSEANSLDDVPKRLHENDSIYWVAVAGGNYLYVGAYLRNMPSMESCVQFVKNEAQMPNPTVGIINLGYPASPRILRDTALTSLDYGIVRSLGKDSRKSISEVADELGVSAKTAGRRLQRMIEGALIELSIEWYPDASNDIMTLFHIHLKNEADREKAVAALINKYSPRALFFWSFSNMPNLLLSMVWTSSMRDLKDIRTSFQAEAFVESVVPNVLYTGYIFDTWRERLPVELTRSARTRT